MSRRVYLDLMAWTTVEVMLDGKRAMVVDVAPAIDVDNDEGSDFDYVRGKAYVPAGDRRLTDKQVERVAEAIERMRPEDFRVGYMDDQKLQIKVKGLTFEHVPDSTGPNGHDFTVMCSSCLNEPFDTGGDDICDEKEEPE